LIPEFLYHGTTKQWHDEQIKRHDCYKGHPIYLSESLESASEHALERKRKFDKASPLLLIIDGSKIKERITTDKSNVKKYTIPQLNSEEYIIVDLPANGVTREVIIEAKRKVKEAFGKELEF